MSIVRSNKTPPYSWIIIQHVFDVNKNKKKHVDNVGKETYNDGIENLTECLKTGGENSVGKT